jgi:hypothetical protein
MCGESLPVETFRCSLIPAIQGQNTGDGLIMKKVIVSAIICLLLVSMAALAADTKAMGVGKTQTVTFAENVKVGNTVLKAGDYRVQHIMDGTQHVLVFKSMTKNDEKARVNCNMVELPKKADQTILGFDVASGQKTLNAITFRGESYKHEL